MLSMRYYIYGCKLHDKPVFLGDFQVTHTLHVSPRPLLAEKFAKTLQMCVV